MKKRHGLGDPIYNAIEVFHDKNILISKRLVYFGSTHYSDEDWGESGVDFNSARMLIKNLLYLDSEEPAPILIHFNSPGGDWHHGMAVYDLIKKLRSAVTIIGYGYVRSMGTIIFQACDHRYLMPNCGFMIHNGYSMIGGNAKDVIANAKEEQYTLQKMYKIYYQKINKKHPKKYTLKDVENMCTYDNFMRPEQAVALGLADKIL